MRCITVLLSIALLLAGCSVVSGLPLESLLIGRRCTCLKQTTSRISPAMFRRLQIIPKRFDCRKMEILIFLKNQDVVCVDPAAVWVQRMILQLRNRQNRTNENQ
ncbi:hypothetical protein FKM82_000911 [Ascaphus truei]